MGQLNVMKSTSSSAYRLSKFALNGLTQLIPGELEGNIKINTVCPGWVSTDMGGESASITPHEAAERIIWLALIDENGPNGKYFTNGREISW